MAYLRMEKESWTGTHALVFQCLKRVAHSPLLNPANSKFPLALNECQPSSVKDQLSLGFMLKKQQPDVQLKTFF